MLSFITDTLLVELNKSVGEDGTVLKPNELKSAISSWFYYDTIEEQIASIYLSLISNHPFFNGNKRTASILVITCKEVGLVTNISSDTELFNLAIKTATTHPSVKQLAKELFKI